MPRSKAGALPDGSGLPSAVPARISHRATSPPLGYSWFLLPTSHSRSLTALPQGPGHVPRHGRAYGKNIHPASVRRLEGLGVRYLRLFFFFNDTATTEIYTLSLHDALPI